MGFRHQPARLAMEPSLDNTVSPTPPRDARADNEKMLRRIQEQLSTVIAYLSAIDALSETWRRCESLRGDRLLFSTIYDSLWDGVIVRLGAIWDGRSDAASLANLADVVRDVPGAAALRDKIRRPRHAERAKLHAHRTKVVAHFNYRQDLSKFDSEFQIDTKVAWADVEEVKCLLHEICDCLGCGSFPFHDVEEMVREDARHSLAVWEESASSRIAQWRCDHLLP